MQNKRMAKKILITGPESTGKTTIASYISSQWKGLLVSEFARDYLEKNGPQYQYEDLLTIAKEHCRIVEQLERDHHQLVLDTYLLNIKIWSEFKYDKVDLWIVDKLQDMSFEHVLLTKADVPWSFDPLRENENNRDDLFALFQDEMSRLKWEYTVLESNEELRKEQVTRLLGF